MEPQEPSPPPPPLPPLPTPQNHPPYLFTPSLQLPYSPSLHPSLINSQVSLPDIDWLSLLSLPTGLGSESMPMTEKASSSSLVGHESINGGGDHIHEQKGINNDMIGKRSRRTKMVRRPRRIAFKTRSEDDILDDGYRWRKYGQKSVKNSVFPRSYYRCTHHTCNVKKQVQRLSKDTSIVVTTYEGNHNHPCEKLMETLTPLLKQIHFLSRF